MTIHYPPGSCETATNDVPYAARHHRVPLATRDGLGQPYGLSWDRRTGQFTASVRIAPEWAIFPGQDQIARWIGTYAARQAALGFEPCK